MCKNVKCADCHFLCSNYREKWTQSADIMSVQEGDRPHLKNGSFPPSYTLEEGDDSEIPELKISLRCWRGNWQADSDCDGCEKISSECRDCDLYIPFEGDSETFQTAIADWQEEHKREVRLHDIEWGTLFFVLGILAALVFVF